MLCDVYFNLTKKLYSIKPREGENKNRVIGHCTSVTMQNITFRVSEKSRLRVLRDRQKNVHAVARGIVTMAMGETFSLNAEGSTRLDHIKTKGKPFTYCPYRAGSFQTIDSDGFKDVQTASELILDTSGNRYMIE
jgi:hypothetical protein